VHANVVAREIVAGRQARLDEHDRAGRRREHDSIDDDLDASRLACELDAMPFHNVEAT
jgi:hypothetical protein